MRRNAGACEAPARTSSMEKGDEEGGIDRGREGCELPCREQSGAVEISWRAEDGSGTRGGSLAG
ncbi:hypothetical protein BE20_16455 [Sorangium cellulosum]|uniref:Uncharacterized protein n=1 Tax=Sorangium cellulosum TaxID=56 RepID=A0A150SEA7_SORCE|nr:hypothetical protein BE20_16455 [Sorangium cellulosum]KYF99688.1 hypothetical protein BE18_18405 [Sorangium cellulosum]